MASFNSRITIEMEIDGVKVSIDGIGTKMIKSIEKIAKRSNALVKNAKDPSNQSEDAVLKENGEMGQICLEFLSEILPEEAYQKLVAEKVEDILYLVDITTFIINEIKKVKEERLLKLLKQSKRGLS